MLAGGDEPHGGGLAEDGQAPTAHAPSVAPAEGLLRLEATRVQAGGAAQLNVVLVIGAAVLEIDIYFVILASGEPSLKRNDSKTSFNNYLVVSFQLDGAADLEVQRLGKFRYNAD